MSDAPMLYAEVLDGHWVYTCSVCGEPAEIEMPEVTGSLYHGTLKTGPYVARPCGHEFPS